MGALSPRPSSATADSPEISAEEFDVILKTLKRLKGFSLDIYKDKCIKRRIAIRIRKTGCASARKYGELLMRDHDEPDLLLKVLTIHVSQFFRNPSMFWKLRDEVLPLLVSRCESEGRDRINLWSVGCAGGEEPYSLAMLLKESFAADLGRFRFDLLGVDVDRDVLEEARQAVYSSDRLVELPVEMMVKWFQPVKTGFRLAPEIREMVTFRQSDLFDDLPAEPCDLILCRNVLIYLERTYQATILKRFAGTLRSGGILVLGKSETLVGESRGYFQTVCPVERIYRAI